MGAPNYDRKQPRNFPCSRKETQNGRAPFFRSCLVSSCVLLFGFSILMSLLLRDTLCGCLWTRDYYSNEAGSTHLCVESGDNFHDNCSSRVVYWWSSSTVTVRGGDEWVYRARVRREECVAAPASLSNTCTAAWLLSWTTPISSHEGGPHLVMTTNPTTTTSPAVNRARF